MSFYLEEAQKIHNQFSGGQSSKRIDRVSRHGDPSNWQSSKPQTIGVILGEILEQRQFEEPAHIIIESKNKRPSGQPMETIHILQEKGERERSAVVVQAQPTEANCFFGLGAKKIAQKFLEKRSTKSSSTALILP